MTTDIETRLRDALAARTELVQPQDLTPPLAPVVGLRPRWQSPWVLLATAAVLLLVLGIVLQGVGGRQRSDRIAPKPDDSEVQLTVPDDVGREWKADKYSTPATLDLDGDGTREKVTFGSERTGSGSGRVRVQATLSSTGKETYGVVALTMNAVVSALPQVDLDDDGDQELALYDGDIVGDTQGDHLHPIVLDLRDGLLVEMVVSEPELLQMGNVPVEHQPSRYYDVVRSHAYWIEDGRLFSGRSVNTFASSPGMMSTRPGGLVLDTWRWRLDASGVLLPVPDGCVYEDVMGDRTTCPTGARDSLPVVGPEATGSFGVGEQFSWTDGYQYDARLEAEADPALVVEGADGRTINHPLEVGDPVVLTTQPTGIFYDGASFVVRSASDPSYLQVLWQDGDRLRVLAPVGEVPLANDDDHRTWLTDDGSLVTVVAAGDGSWRAWFWQMASDTEMAAIPAGAVCFDDVDDPSTARSC